MPLSGIRGRSLLLALLTVLGAARAEALTAPEPCDGDLDPVLTVGWPVGRGDEIPRLARLIGEFHRVVGRCPERSLQVNVAYGTDYELLAWIVTGEIDAALLPPLAVDLARRDGIALRPVVTWSDSRIEVEPPGAELETFFDRVQELGPDGAEGVFLTAPTHLSNEFYVVLEAAARYLAAKQLDAQTFWPNLFSHLCFRPLGQEGRAPRPCVVSRDSKSTGPELALTLRRRAMKGSPAAPPLPDPRLGGSLPEWLAVRPEIAESLFRLESSLGWAFPDLATDTRRLLADLKAPDEIRELASADPRLGTRSFTFTLGEALGLLHAHGQATGTPRLALVLPGGGVKAVYQTTMVDALYGQRRLRNPLAGLDDYGAPPAEEPLQVDLVTGTSGGALVGYFVARLTDQGPFDLTRRLWFRDEAGDEALDYGNVFPPADLLRYLSLVLVFMIFSAALATFALRRKSPFSLERLTPPPHEAQRYLSRPLLGIAALGLLLATPFAVRFVNGAEHQEHIPDVEGFVYLLLALLAMFADQCLVAVDERREPSTGRTAALITLFAGLAAVTPPLVARWQDSRGVTASWHPLFELVTPFWAAFCLFAPIFVVPLLLARSRSLGLGTVPGARDFLQGLAEFALVAVLALWLFLGVGAVRSSIDALGPFLFGLLLVATLLLFFLRPAPEGRATPRLQGLYFGSLFVAALFVIAIARPATLPAAGFFDIAQILELSRENSKLGVNLGSLAISVGALMLFAGTLFALASWRPRYRLENVRPFATALALCLGHAAVSFGLVALAAQLGWVSFFELTLEYWLALGIVAWGLAVAGLFSAGLFARGKLLEAFQFLASPHPNGRYRVRRHVRMVQCALFAWGFWNLVVAPGFYGNRFARDQIERVATDFGAHRGFTAPLLVPANALRPTAGESDGSRYFLLVPRRLPCPPIPRNPATGGRWQVLHVPSLEPHAEHTEICQDLDSPQTILSIIFASGSPFPVFPAHRVEIPGKPAEFLVDGGYSNNVPIAPGQNLRVNQVLVLDSTNPLAADPISAGGGRFSGLVGSLVDNFLRLPGYLFGRAQALDLQSRRDFFVVRVAPHRSHRPWPFLTDFRNTVVRRMTKVAHEDLGRRVARVESWGRPRFVRSWRTQTDCE